MPRYWDDDIPGDPWAIDPSDLEPGDSIWRYDLTAALDNGYTLEEIEIAYERFTDAMAEWDAEGRPGDPPDEMHDWFVDVLDYFDEEEWEERYG